jgi:hypothetical protein
MFCKVNAYTHSLLTSLDRSYVAGNSATDDQQIFLICVLLVTFEYKGRDGFHLPASVAYDRLDGRAMADGATTLGKLNSSVSVLSSKIVLVGVVENTYHDAWLKADRTVARGTIRLRSIVDELMLQQRNQRRGQMFWVNPQVSCATRFILAQAGCFGRRNREVTKSPSDVPHNQPKAMEYPQCIILVNNSTKTRSQDYLL